MSAWIVPTWNGLFVIITLAPEPQVTLADPQFK